MNAQSRPPAPSAAQTYALAILSILAIGCGAPVPADREGTSSVETVGKETIATAAADARGDDAADSNPRTAPEINFQTADAEGYAEVLARHRGKVVLVDFWATWCPHCVEQFPHTVQLHHDLAGDGLAVVSVSMDDESDRQEALDMLRKFGATFDNLLSQHGARPQAMEGFQIESLPSYKLYDRQGELRYELADDDPDRPLSTDDIDARVAELLAEK